MKASKDGLQSRCRVCSAEYSAEYYRLHRPRILRVMRAYRQTLYGKLSSRVKAVRKRCCNPDDMSYKYYGRCGIMLQFTTRELYDWIMERGIDPDDKEIHRIDNDGNYALDNIEFLTKDEHIQAHRDPVPF